MPHVDFGRHSDDYAAYRRGLPESFYDRIDSIVPIRQSQALDLATGTGVIAIALAARGASVVGIDISAEQIATAKRVAKERNLEQEIDYRIARAERTGLSANSFDLVTANQCWHWFDRDAVMAEVLRVLRPGGVLAITHHPYLATMSAVARDTEALILEFNPGWTMAGSNGLYPDEIDDVIRGGFEFVEAFAYDKAEEFTHAQWRGRIRTCNGVGSGGILPAEVVRFDEALEELLRDKYPDPMLIEHRVWCVVARKMA